MGDEANRATYHQEAVMKTETYTCDRCAHAQDRDRKFDGPYRWMRTITLCMEEGFVHRSGTAERFLSRDIVKTVLWCDQCCTETGIDGVTRLARPKPDEAPAPTLEDMVRDIV